jgi:hypothetical protein
MPRFHLHLKNRIGFLPDLEGQDLPSEQAAREEAIRSIRSIASADVLDGFLDLEGSVEIVDAHGLLLAVVPFAEAVHIRAET